MKTVLEKIPDYLADAVIAADFDGRINYVNPSAAKMLQTTSARIVGKQLTESVRIRTLEGGKSMKDSLENVIRKNSPMKNANHSVLVTGKGKELHVSYDILPAVFNRKRGVVLIIRSTDAQLNKENETEQKLAKLNRELEQFAYIASHDLQEPLRMVASYVQLLQRRYQGKLDNDADEFISYTVSGVNRMKDILNDLLSYSRLNTRKEEPVEVNCNELVCKITDNFTSKPEVKVAFEITPLPVVVCVASQFIQLFYHLIDNAIKFSRPGLCVVKISAEESPLEWTFHIEDRGIGIDQRYSEKIYEMFQRLHNSKEYPGTGVGLALCKKIVELHGGSIWFESVMEEGTVFHFTLPKIIAVRSGIEVQGNGN